MERDDAGLNADLKSRNSIRGGVSRRAFVAGGAAFMTSLFLPFEKAQALPQFEPFSFVHITDAHLVNGMPDTGLKLLQESQLFLQETIKYVNKLKPTFVIFGGDQVEQVGKDEVNWLLFGDLAQALESPWCFVLGETDISGKAPVDKMRTFGSDWRARGITTGQPYWSLNPCPGVHIVGLDSSVANVQGGLVSRAQLEWLKEDLQANKGKLTIVFCHHPVLPPPPFDGPPWDQYVMPDGSDVREILGGSQDVRMVVSGHVYVNKVQVERDIYHVSCAGLNIYPCQYKHFRVSKEGILMESFEVAFPALVKKAEKAAATSTMASSYNSKNPNAFLELLEGAREDQNSILSFTGKGVQAVSKKDLEKQAEGKGKDEKDEKKDKKDKKDKKKGKGEDKEEKSDKKEKGKDKPSKSKDKGGKDKESKSDNAEPAKSEPVAAPGDASSDKPDSEAGKSDASPEPKSDTPAKPEPKPAKTEPVPAKPAVKP